MCVGNERGLGLEEACQHCCLSTHNVIGLLRRGWELTRWARISMGAESGQLGVSGGTGWSSACVYVCAREGSEEEERKKRGIQSVHSPLTAAAQPFSPPHLLLLLSGPFLVYSMWCKQGTASLGVSGIQVKKRGYPLHLHPQ